MNSVMMANCILGAVVLFFILLFIIGRYVAFPISQYLADKSINKSNKKSEFLRQKYKNINFY